MTQIEADEPRHSASWVRISRVPHDCGVEGIVVDQSGVRPFQLDLHVLEGQAFGPTARASLLFQPNDQTLFLQPAELVGGRGSNSILKAPAQLAIVTRAGIPVLADHRRFRFISRIRTSSALPSARCNRAIV